MRAPRLIALLVASMCIGAAGDRSAGAAEHPRLASLSAQRFAEVEATPATVDALRAGGFALYLRHAPTDNTRPDRLDGMDFDDCGAQRPLSEEGLRVAAAVGSAILAAGIPIGDVHVSPLCRARDTAAAALPGRPFMVEPLLSYTANLTDAQKAPILARTAALLSAPPPPGTNRLLVAHAPNLMDLIGYFPSEAALVVFRPRGDAGFEYVASIPPRLWASLQGGR